MCRHTRTIITTATIILSILVAAFVLAGDRLKPSGDQPKNEFWIGASYEWASDEWLAKIARYSSWLSEQKVLGIHIRVIRRPGGRFSSDSIPFGFVLYDYRTSYIGGAMSFARESRGSWTQEILGLQAAGAHYGKSHFISFGINYAHELYHLAPHNIGLEAGAGYHNHVILAGVVIPLVYAHGSGRRLTAELHGVGLRLAYTPSSMQSLSVSPIYIATRGENWYYDIPVSYAVTLPDYWVTIRVGAHYYREPGDYARFGPSAFVRKYFGDNSIWISSAYDMASYYSGYDENAYTVEVGIELVFNRSAVLTLRYGHSSSNSGYPFVERDTNTNAVTLRFSMLY